MRHSHARTMVQLIAAAEKTASSQTIAKPNVLRRAIYVGSEFPDHKGYEVEVDDDHSQPNCPCYKIKMDGEWIDNIDDDDIRFSLA